MYKYNDLTGKTFGRLTVIKQNGRAKDRHILWECSCECGRDVTISSRDIISGHTMSCGCLQKESTSRRRFKHGGSGNHKRIERLYKIWIGMRKRCYTKTDESYKYYGAIGIKICKEWDDYSEFRKWAYENGYNANAPFSKCTIDRINPYGDYEPLNCRWVDMYVQSKNKRARITGGEANA